MSKQKRNPFTSYHGESYALTAPRSSPGSLHIDRGSISHVLVDTCGKSFLYLFTRSYGDPHTSMPSYFNHIELIQTGLDDRSSRIL